MDGDRFGRNSRRYRIIFLCQASRLPPCDRRASRVGQRDGCAGHANG